MNRSLRPIGLTTLILGVLCAWPSLAADAPSAGVPLVDEPIRQAMQDGDYAGAITAIDAAIAAEAKSPDYLTYLKGRALHMRKKYAEAVAVFDQLQKQFPKSGWLRRARFAKAVSLARKGDFRGAELIYRAEAEYLLSGDRKQQIADIYLEFARAYFDPPEENKKPDHAKALEFFKKALEMGPKPESRAEVELLVAQCHQELKQHGEAAKLYEKFIEDHAASPLDVEARYRLGQCRLAEGNLKQARRVWQDLLAKHVDSQSERMADTSFYLSRTYNAPNPQNDDQLSLAVGALEAFVERFPEHKLAGRAHLEIAQCYVVRQRYEDAAKSLVRFLADERYKDREEVPDARTLLGRSYLLQKKFAEALATWREYLAKHPAHKAWSAVQREIIAAEYLKADEQYKAKHYDEARKLWAEFLVQYPLDAHNPRILLMFGRMNHQEKKWEAAIADWRRLVSKYPGTNESSEAQYLIGATLEEELGKLDEALEEYRKLNWGSHSSRARQAAARLTQRTMTVATERTFRSDETPGLKLTTRNIETLTVRAYKVDLETYFRKMHLAGRIEQLDIALIDPDATFEFKVPKYEKYRKLESRIEVPLPKKATSGVMIVTVSSKTLEATTLVVQSDLDAIVKSSRDEVFVFAQNMLTGKPWPDVRLLISDGKNVFAEAATGEDGVFKSTYKELKPAADLRVFAVAGGNVASSVVGLEGVGVAKGLADKGYIHTDRPAYRAGQIVHLRGCFRRAANDAYTIEKDKKYTVEVFDARNRLVWQKEAKLGEFGTFAAHFGLPRTSPQGNYRVLARDAAGHTFQGSFIVQEYRLEPIRVTVDTPRKVYYRGEQIEGTIRVEYYYGAPLADCQVRYQLADDRLHTVTTDAKGEIKFKLPTREFRETQGLPLVVTLPERNLQTAVNFLLSTRGFSIDVSTVRSVYMAGETLEVTVNAKDAESKPVGRKLTLKVFEQTTVEGKVGERLVEEHELETAKADGAARQTIKLDKGGTYLLRAEGIDRFHNPISGGHSLKISGEDDTERLRILADKHTFKVGDTAAVRLLWREQPALALVTFQGARVLDYKLVELAAGANELAVPMTARLAPNFDLAVAVMRDVREAKDDKPIRRLHTASSPFTVQRDLRVSVSVKKAKDGKGPIRPGSRVEVTVTTTDPQGKPVAAELSLAMVEQSLLDRFSWPIASIGDFFRGGRRQSAVRTTSSITFSYHPGTKPINPRLLAEADRLEIAREEEASRLAAVTATRRPNEPAANAPAPAEAPATAAPRGDGRLMFGVGVNSEAGVVGGMVGSDWKKVEKANVTGGQWRLARNGGKSKRQKSRMGLAGVYDEPLEMGSIQSFAATSENIQEFAKRSGSGVLVLQSDGSVQTLGYGGYGAFDHKLAEDLADKLTKAGAVLLAASAGQETGYWNPAVVTGEDGRATVSFTLPERSTAWQLLAKGITVDTLAGEATDKLVVKKDLFGQLKLPAAFTDGDDAEVAVSVHNTALTEGQIRVTLKTTIGGKSVEEQKTVDVKAHGIHELAFKTSLRRPDPSKEKQDSRPAADVNVAFELTVSAGERRDVVRQTVPLKPYGMPVFATSSGSATGDTTAWVEAPKEMPLEGPALQILIGPTVERSLLDIVLGPAPVCQIESNRLSTGLESSVSDLMAAVALQKLLGASRDGGNPEAQSLDGRIRASLGLLVSSQNEKDGGWSWTGRGQAGNRYGSSRIVWALSLARAAGYKVPDECYNKAIAYLTAQAAATANSDYESKAILLHALATAGRGDFAVANRLYRDRASLSPAALAYLSLAFARMDRKSTAGELLDLLAERNLDATPSRRADSKGSLPWSHSPVEVRALAALGLQSVAPKSPKAKVYVDWLLAHRTGHRWSPDKATGPAAMALCRWFAQTRFDSEHYKLALFVNDVQVQVLDVDQAGATRVIDVPAKLLKKGKQRINFQMTGRGRYTYQCILGGFVPAEKLKNTTKDWYVRRYYQPARLELDGREIPRGFGGLQGGYSSFRNPLTQLPVGKRGTVDLEVWRQNYSSNTPEQHMEYLVVTEPIPCGTTVIEKSVRGAFERFEISPGAITFYIGSRRSIGMIHYELYGYLPGSYRAGPTVVRNAHRPEQLAVSKPKSLAVLPPGVKSTDEYRLSPEELLELGKRYFEKKDYKTAGKHLTELLEKWNVNTDVYKQSVGMLLDVHLELGPPAKVVHYFEIIKEKWPAEEIPFDKIVKVGAAYHEMGEYERSYLVFRATVQSSFVRESGVAGFIESQGEFIRGIGVMSRLLAEYPPESYTAAASYALAQRVYAKAPEAAKDPKLRQQKINSVELIRRAWGMLESFLTAYPDDPAADQAAFATANALLELKAYKRAAAACDNYAKRYPKSDLLDSYWYMIGYCHFATGEHKQALAMCQKVAEAKRLDKATGRTVESTNKWRAIYILGQVHHSLGQAAKAVAEYTRVKDRFADAKEAIAYFLHKAIELPEVTTVKPGEDAQVELKFRNIPACDAKVYRIDLMKFSLLKRNLGGITQINLAGIRPYHEATVELGDGKDYRDRTHKLPLPLKEEGAYLVVCRGENLHASGLVLVTPLAVEVDEEQSSGRVRTTVKDVAADRYLKEVHVKVIGSRNPDFFAGQTDLRGVFVANGIQGTSTVIARADGGRYAFFRGKTDLGPRPHPVPEPSAKPRSSVSKKKAPVAQPAAPADESLLKGLQKTNFRFQGQQVEQLKQMYDSQQQGVEAQKAF